MKPRVKVWSYMGASWYLFEGKVYRNESDEHFCAVNWSDLKVWGRVPFIGY